MLPLEALVEESRRQLTVCNACRYCEGYCSVFPALELRPELRVVDVAHLANLCHECGACLQACMYAPPHEFGVDIPKALREVREATYVEYAWPRRIATMLWAHPYRAIIATLMVGWISAVITALALTGDAVVKPHLGPGAFYAVVPWLAMMVPALIATAFVLAVIAGSIRSFWRSGPRIKMGQPVAWVRAVWDALRLRNLTGGGPGCPYPDRERPSNIRRRLHHLIFYGVAADFASTISAAVYQDVQGQLPPYPIWSLPVVLGSVGGVAIIIGCSGMLYLRYVAWKRSGERPSASGIAFLVVLNLVSITGMALLAFRSSPALGALLTAHLATLVALYATLPYGKFVHGAFRLAALLRNRFDEIDVEKTYEPTIGTRSM